MNSANNTSFEYITNKVCRKENVAEEPSVPAHQQNVIPEALQEVKSPTVGTSMENVMEKLKAGKHMKEKHSNDLDRASLKRKLENDEKMPMRKEAQLLESESQPVTVFLPHIPLKSLVDVEMKLVYSDEEAITYEFLERQGAISTRLKCQQAMAIDSQTAPDMMGALPQMDRWLQVALKDASTCYRQKKYAAAAGQFRTALDAMIEEAITRAESFSVMYTPCVTQVNAEKVDTLKEAFTKKHPDYVEYISTDPHGLHSLPQTADWSHPSPQSYLLTLGFKNKEVGKFLEKMSCRKLPTFSEHKAPFSPLTKEEAERHLETLGKRVLPIMDFIRGTKLTESFCACSGVIEKLQHASLLGRLQRIKEQSQVINQAMAELATIPYLQELSQQDAELMQSLMTDAMDSLEGRKSDKECVWNKIQKVGIIEDFLYQLEDSFLKTKKLRTARRQKMKMKRLQTEQPC